MVTCISVNVLSLAIIEGVKRTSELLSYERALLCNSLTALLASSAFVGLAMALVRWLVGFDMIDQFSILPAPERHLRTNELVEAFRGRIGAFSDQYFMWLAVLWYYSSNHPFRCVHIQISNLYRLNRPGPDAL